jgi:hypothetical protein
VITPVPVTMGLTSADRIAVAQYPELRKLITLREDHGWQFVPNYRHGELALLVGFHVWLPEGWSDAIAVADRDDAKAYRCDPAGGEVWGPAPASKSKSRSRNVPGGQNVDCPRHRLRFRWPCRIPTWRGHRFRLRS